MPPYTFIATVNVVLLHYALPVFVDIRPGDVPDRSRQDRGGHHRPHGGDHAGAHRRHRVADMDTILAVAKKHNLPVIEDACQAHLAEWRGRKRGHLGTTGCFSFQVTKNLCSGEGGAILTDDERAGRTSATPSTTTAGRGTVDRLQLHLPRRRAANFRMTEFQGALLLAQMTRLEQQRQDPRARTPSTSPSMLREIPGIAAGQDVRRLHAQRLSPLHVPLRAARSSPACRGRSSSRPSAPREFPAPAATRRLKRRRSSRTSLQSRGYRRVYSEAELDRWAERTPCPREREALRRGGLVHADHVPRSARRHGPDRRGGAQDPGQRRGTGQDVTRRTRLSLSRGKAGVRIRMHDQTMHFAHESP